MQGPQLKENGVVEPSAAESDAGWWRDGSSASPQAGLDEAM